MNRVSTIDDVVVGAVYALPSGQRVRAQRGPGGLAWLLPAVDGQRVYSVDPRGGVWFIMVVTGAWLSGTRGAVSYGMETDFTVADLQLVRDA